jgi:hypothetical protein
MYSTSSIKFRTWALRSRLARLALVAGIVFIVGFVAGVVSGRDTLVWSAVYIAFTFGSAIGGRWGYNDGADDAMRAMKRVLDGAAIAVGVTVGESLQSLRDDDDRRQQAPNN